MKLSLIGMSGVGKTYWAKQLESWGFQRFSCDDVIEQKLAKELKQLGYSGINDVAKWMGQPYDHQYKQHSQTYLQFEKEAMKEIYAMITQEEKQSEKIVIDTTGSIIYTGKPILDMLAKYTSIIFLETPESVMQEMYDVYITDPKPVFWGNAFSKRTDETNTEALQRCYPDLLQFRIKEYEKLAHTKIDYYELRNLLMPEQFCKLLRDVSNRNL